MIGFACKINTGHETPDPKLNIKSTTITWLNNNPQKAHEKLLSLVQHNLSVLYAQIDFVGKLPATQRMFRISSDLLPAYTYEAYMPFYFSNEIIALLEKELKRCGDLARKTGVRLSFHPGQFCVLASDNPGVVENSIVEFEYHADVIRYMGYGQKFQDFKCNVHIGGKQGPAGIKQALSKLSREARNCLTIENAEFSWGLEASLELARDCALVLDVHHDWIHSNRYLSPRSSEVQQVIDSWRGVRPVIHYSQSKCLEDSSSQELLFIEETSFTKSALRAHSDYYYNNTLNQLILEHHSWADVMCESKQKNLASAQLAKAWGL
jgi:UV DNA damage endonuclease